MGRFFRRLSDIAAIVAGALIVLMMVHVTAEVSLRVLFGMHIPGTMEIVTYYYMIAGVFIGIFSCTVDDAHIRVDVVAQFLKAKARSLIDGFGLVVTTGYFILFSYGLYLQATKSWHRSETVDAIVLELPIWPSRWLAFLGILLAALASLYLLSRFRQSRGTGSQEGHP